MQAKDLIVLSKSIKYHYKNPPLIGLINLGYTDYYMSDIIVI